MQKMDNSNKSTFAEIPEKVAQEVQELHLGEFIDKDQFIIGITNDSSMTF